MHYALLTFVLLALLAPFSYLVGRAHGRRPRPEPLEVPLCWRRINLAVGDGFRHPDADPALAGLRAAGWYVEKQGSERGGFVYLKLLRPEDSKCG